MFLTYFVWIWTICIGLTNQLPQELAIRTNIINILATMLIVCVLYRFWIEFFSDDPAKTNSTFADVIDSICMFLILAFINLASKILKSAETRKSIRFSEHLGEFFLIWFFPIGIWNIQPRINRVTKE